MRRQEGHRYSSALTKKPATGSGAGLKRLRCCHCGGDLADVSFFGGDRAALTRQCLITLALKVMASHFTRRPWKKPLLVVFCRILAESPCSLVFWA